MVKIICGAWQLYIGCRKPKFEPLRSEADTASDMHCAAGPWGWLREQLVSAINPSSHGPELLLSECDPGAPSSAPTTIPLLT